MVPGRAGRRGAARRRNGDAPPKSYARPKRAHAHEARGRGLHALPSSRPPAHRHELAVHPDFDEDVGVQGLDGHFGRTGAAAPLPGNRAELSMSAESTEGGPGEDGRGTWRERESE